MTETEFDFENRIITSDFTPEDNDIENSLRPKSLDEYIVQDKVKENLKIYIEAEGKHLPEEIKRKISNTLKRRNAKKKNVGN